MPERKTLRRVRRDKRQGKAPSTQAGEFIREEMEHIRERKHGARSTRQAIAIGLSKARRAGVDLPPPSPGNTSGEVRRRSARDYAVGHGTAPRRRSTAKRSRASSQALKREGHAAASQNALSSHARATAERRSSKSRSASARRAVRTKGPLRRAAAARKAARTRRMTMVP